MSWTDASKEMIVTIVQTSLAWQDPASNRAHIGSLLEGLGRTDLIVLPEMFSTGFVTRPVGGDDGKSLRWMQELAARKDCAVTGSLSVHLEDGWRNRLYFVRPDGSCDHYDKRHLFTFSGEDKSYVAGNERKVVEWRGWRIMLQVCYDLRFPSFSRNSLSDRYDLLLYVASWPEVRSYAWDTLLRARAIENQCFLAGVNRVGTDEGNSYSGDSVILDYMGAPLALCTPSKESVMSAELDMDGLQAYRKSFPVIADADKL